MATVNIDTFMCTALLAHHHKDLADETNHSRQSNGFYIHLCLLS
jgi:hypothetical protein